MHTYFLILYSRLGQGSKPMCLLHVQALDAGSAAALPDGLRAELEQLEDHGGVSHLHDLAAQIKVYIPILSREHDRLLRAGVPNCFLLHKQPMHVTVYQNLR